MADEIKIPIAGDASKFLRETDDVEKALDDVADALDDVADESKDAGRDGERSFKKLTEEVKDADKATDRLTDSFEQARRKAKDVGDDGGRNLGKVKDGAQEVTQELGQNLGEAVSSVRGDLSDLGQVGQDTLGGLAATLAGTGPGGIVAAAALAAGAVGLGLVTAELENAEEQSRKLSEAAAGWASKFVESGQKIVTAAQTVAEVNSIAADPERYEEARQNAKDWGVDTSTAMLAMAGDGAALGIVQDSITSKQKEWGRVVEETTTGSGLSWDKSNMTAKQKELGDEVIRGTAAYEGLTGALAEGARRADEVSKAYYKLIDNAEDATIQVDELGNKVVTLPDGTQIFIDAETGEASRNVDNFKGDLDEIPKKKAVTVNGTVDLSDVTRGIKNYRPPSIKVYARVNFADRFGRGLG